jgi:hypothetical protein
MKGVVLDKDDEQKTRIAAKSMDDDSDRPIILLS